MIKKPLKRLAQHFAARFGPHKRKHADPRLLVLMYHRILPDNDDRVAFEEPGMTVSPATFRMHLDILSEYFELIKLSDWLERKQNGQPLPHMCCAITFDDGWRDNYEFAFPILREMQIPATIFVVTGLVGTSSLFWPERLARLASHISRNRPELWQEPALTWLQDADTDFAFSRDAPNRLQITQLIAYAKRYTDQEIDERLDLAENQLNLHIPPAPPALLSWQQINDMLDSKLIDIGSHTCHHTRLNEMLSEGKARTEILDSKADIESRTNSRVTTFCFPNGDYTNKSLELVSENYLGAVTTRHGWNTTETDNYLLSRIGIHEDIAKDKTAFLARISGWL